MDRQILWAARLQEEHEQICYQRRISMETPVVEILESRERLGLWHPGRGLIGISGHLIRTQPWETVVEVLKHEMAHQYVSVHMDSDPGHGSAFKQACRILGVHPAFAGARTAKNGEAVLEQFRGELPENARKMLSRIEKLMALGTSDNEAEARAASQKASYLLNKYHLDQSSLKMARDPVQYLVITHKKRRISSLEKSLALILNRYYFVNVVLTSTYDPHACQEYKAIALIGRRAALEVAEYVYHFLRDTGERIWQAYRKEKGINRGRPMFDYGFTKGLVENHERALETACDQAREPTLLPRAASMDLVTRAKQALNAETERLFSRTSRRKSRVSGTRAAYEAGVEKGRNTIVNRSVAEGHSGQQQRLPQRTRR